MILSKRSVHGELKLRLTRASVATSLLLAALNGWSMLRPEDVSALNLKFCHYSNNRIGLRLNADPPDL